MQNIESVIKNLPSSKELESLAKDGGKKWNRLVFEKSPYLLQHAANPVDWYPWSDEAFQKAKKENKPVFLSIGYSTCHWCHVMEHESFEDNDVAALLNKNFVCIKVDREERPDIDNVYMSFCQMLTGRGGWPLNVFLSPDKKVFHTMTYVPKQSRQVPGGQIPGMLDLIPHIGRLWQEQKDQLLQTAENILESSQEDLKDLITGDTSNHEESINAVYHKAFAQLAKKFDKEFGGFGQAPKFPSPHIISFLLRYHERFKNNDALEMAARTLKSMRFGGLFDQIGFGFHRYSTDKEWLLPHFEKMLYDQATQMIAYSEAYKLNKDDFYKEVVNEIFKYITRDLQSPLGAFYSAEDADSEGEEGKFYVWTTEEIKKILGKDTEAFLDAYNCTKEGNYLDEASHQKTGLNIPHLKHKPNQQEASREKLFNKRLKRVRPLLDDKILTDWNSLIIVALSKAYTATQEDKYLSSAIKAYEFIEKYLSNNNQLLKSYRSGKANSHAVLADYAYFIWASLELYQASFEIRFLEQAIKTTGIMIKEFWDEKENAFFFSMKSSKELPVNNKEFYDGALPSGNSIAAMVLAQLYKITGDDKYNTLANQLASLMLKLAEKYPIGYTQFLNSLEFYLPDATQIVGVSETSKSTLKKYQTKFKANQTLIYKELAESNFQEGEVYECEADACKLVIIQPQLQPRAF